MNRGLGLAMGVVTASSSVVSLAALFLVISTIFGPATATAYERIQTLRHQATGFEGLSEPQAVAVSPDGRHLYVGGLDTLVVLERDQDTGTLVPLQTLETALGAYDLTFLSNLVVSPDGQNLYGASMINSALVVFTRDPASGLLTLVEQLFDNDNGIDGLRGVSDLEMSSDGRYLYALAFSEAKVSAFARNITSGSLSLIDVERGTGGTPGLVLPQGAALAADGAHYYVADRVGGLLIFSRDLDSGELTYLGAQTDEVLSGSNLIDLVLDPTGESLYVIGSGFSIGNGMIEFDRDPTSGSLTQRSAVTGIEVTGGFGDPQLLVDGTGANVYVTAESRVEVFARAPGGGLTLSQTIRDGVDGVESLVGGGLGVLDPLGRYLYIPALHDEAVAIFERSASSGELAFVDAIFDGEGATLDGLGDILSLDVPADGKDVYVLGQENQVLAQYHRDAAGFLDLGQVIPMRELGLEDFRSVTGQFGSPGGRHHFVADDSGELWIFDRGVDGGLVLRRRGRLEENNLGNNSKNLEKGISIGNFAFSSDSRFIFTSYSDVLSVWDFDDDSTEITHRTTTYWGPSLFRSLAVGPQGRMLYGGEQASSLERARITVVAWNETTNSLTWKGQIRSPALGDEVRQLLMTPDGRHLIATGAGETAGGPPGLVVFARDATTGMLTEVQRLINGVGGVSGMANPILGDLSPSGTRLMVSAGARNRPPTFSNFFARNPVTGHLTLLEQRVVGDGSGPAEISSYQDLAWSPAGNQFYVASRIHDTLFAFDENAAVPCVPGLTTLCLGEGGRFRVEVAWRNFAGQSGVGTKVTDSPDSGLFWFFDSANWEMLVKLVDGCDFNGRFWVFAAATTNVEYTLTVTDTLRGASAVYRNFLGESAPAVADSQALATCP